MRFSLESLKLGLAAACVAGGLGLATAEAAPFAPASGLAGAAVAGAAPVTQAAYVCGPWGCRWRPGPRWGGYGYYGPRPVYGYGPPRRCFWRPTPWGPRRICRGW